MRTYWIFTLLCVLSVSMGKAQNPKMVDSLTAIYTNSSEQDTSRYAALKTLFNLHMYSDQEKSRQYLQLATELAYQLNDSAKIADSHGSNGIYFDIQGQADSSKFYYYKAVAYYEQQPDKPEKLRILRFNIAMLEHKLGNLDTAIALANSNIIDTAIVTESGYLSQGLSYGLLTRLYAANGYHQLALKNGLLALHFFELMESELHIADAYRDLAAVESYMLNFDKSISYSQKAIAIYKTHNDDYFLGTSLMDLGYTYLENKQWEEALRVFEKGVTVGGETQNDEVVRLSHLGIGQVCYETGNFNKANKHLDTAMVMIQEQQTKGEASYANVAFGNLFCLLGEYDSSLLYLNNALLIAAQSGDLEMQKEAYLSRSETHQALQDFESALADYQQFHLFSDSIFKEKKIHAIEELRIIHQKAQQEKEILILEKNQELDQLKRNRLILLIVGVLIMATLIIFWQYQWRNNEKKIAQEQQKVVALENEQLSKELVFKKQELTSKVLQLCRKNEFLQSLVAEVEELKNHTNQGNLNPFNRLTKKINQDMSADEVWDEFLQSFESIHPKFKDLVRSMFPNLAPNEVRLTYLMRMNLDTKSIALLLNVTPDGVKKARYRLRKKIALDSTINLTEYFLNLDQNQLSKAS